MSNGAIGPFGQLPPEVSRAPMPEPPGGAGFGGRFARAWGQAQQRGGQMRAYAGQRAAYVAAASARLRAIGTPEAEQLASIVETNPEGAAAFVGQYGGWEQLETGLLASAARGKAEAYAGTLEAGSPARAQAEYEAAQRTPNLAPSLASATARSEGAAERAARASEGALNRASAERVAGIRAGAVMAPGGEADRYNRQVERSRATFRELQKLNGWSEADVRRIAAKAKNTDPMRALLVAMGGGEGVPDEEYAASLWAVGSRPMKHTADDDYDTFLNLAEGDLAGRADEARAQRARESASEFMDFYYRNRGQ